MVNCLPRIIAILVLLSTVASSSYSAGKQESKTASILPKKEVTIQILQLNDVYEFYNVSGGTLGGLARVANRLKLLKAQNPNTFTVLSGDFISPSAFGLLEDPDAPVTGGKRPQLSGKLMVNVLKALPVDFVTFGNHEFDYSAKDNKVLESLIKDSHDQMTWVSTNVMDGLTGQPFEHTVPWLVKEIDGAKFAFIGITLNITGQSKKIAYKPPIDSAIALAKHLKETKLAVVVIALTHLPLEGPKDNIVDSDEALMKEIERVKKESGTTVIDLVLGGHEHEFSPKAFREKIFKADSNARSVIIHKVTFIKGSPGTTSDAVRVNSDIERVARPEFDVEECVVPAKNPNCKDPSIDKVIADQLATACRSLLTMTPRIDPDQVVGYTDSDLNGFEQELRKEPTNLGTLIGNTLQNIPGYKIDGRDVVPVGAIYNSGGIRLDDVIPVGLVTEWQIRRMLAFPLMGKAYRIKGKRLLEMLAISEQKKNTGAYLQRSGGIMRTPNSSWQIEGQPILPDEIGRAHV